MTTLHDLSLLLWAVLFRIRGREKNVVSNLGTYDFPREYVYVYELKEEWHVKVLR
jgi:hypothetical protein